MINLDTIVGISDKVVARKIQGETIIIPLTADVGEIDEELYSLNKIGEVIWQELDGAKTVGDICRNLAQTFTAPLTSVQNDVIGFLTELAERKIVILQNASASSA